MADISTFTDLSGNTYNVKDAVARAKLDGVIGIDHGGTGETTAEDAVNALMSGLEYVSSTPAADHDDVILRPLAGMPIRRSLINVWDYIERKILRGTVLGVSAPTSPIWVRGAINSTTGAATSSTTRLRTNAFYPVPAANGLTIDVPEGFKLYVMGYSKADESYYSGAPSHGWATGTFSMYGSDANFVRFVIAKTGNETITVAEAPELSFYSVMPTDSTVSEPNKAADAWAVANILGLSKEFDNVARKSYTVGSCFVIGARLYRVTAAVSAGDNFVEGTNVEATTILDEIARANSSN